mgnify:CR=1 FL=1
MYSNTIDTFKYEITSSELEALGLPSDVIKKKVVTVSNTVTSSNGTSKILLHYHQSKIDDVIAGRFPYTHSQVEAIKSCRGIILDGNTKEKIVQSFPVTSIIEIDSVPEDGLLPIRFNGDFKTPETGNYTKCCGGALVRVFCDSHCVRNVDHIDDSGRQNDNYFCSTHKKIDATKSHFGSSDNFTDILLSRQSVFPTIESMYANCDSDIIHLFILNDRSLLVDSRELQDDDHIVYLRSFSVKNRSKTYDLTDFIEEANKTADRPILLNKKLTSEEVNNRLYGVESKIDYSKSTSGTHVLQYFSSGERIIYENEFGIFTLMPHSCGFRQGIMGGKVNNSKIMIDLISDVHNDTLIDVAFSPIDLKDIIQKIKNGEKYDFGDYTMIRDNHRLKVLTNMVLIVPLHRVDECFEIFDSYGTNLLNAIKYMISISSDLHLSIINDELNKFSGIQSVGVKFKKYLENITLEAYGSAFIPLDNTENSWPVEVSNFYNEEYQRMLKMDGSYDINEMKINLRIISLVAGTTGENLYSMIIYKNKVDKEIAAYKKRLNA